MERIYTPGEWIESRVATLTKDETLRTIYRAILERTIGEAADDINFPFDRYKAADKIGRPEKADVVGQWLCAERRNDETALDERKLSEFLQEADLDTLWTHAGERLDALDAHDMLPSLEGDEKKIKTHANGWNVVSILTPEGARNEYHRSGMSGVAMAGAEDFLYVIRNGDGHAEAMVTGYEGVVTRVSGPRGKRLPPHVAADHVLPLIAEHGFWLREPTTVHGHCQTEDGLIHDLRDLPEHSVVDGSLLINDPEDARRISKLPDGLWVKGWFGLVGAPYFTATPRNMRVDGHCGFIECSGLKTISEGLMVSEMTEIAKCHNISRIENLVDFGSYLSIPADLKELDAAPFKAGKVAAEGEGFTGDDQSYVRRDGEGRVLLATRDLERMVQAKKRAEIASLPGLLVKIAVGELESNVKNGIRGATRAVKGLFSGEEKQQDENGPKPRF